jgi:GH24 family phage-related lysozyme (muramidase)
MPLDLPPTKHRFFLALSDYAKRQDMAKARAVYQSIVTNFSEEEYLPIRRAAESALTQLNDMEKEAK